jgi:hypothetical protein
MAAPTREKPGPKPKPRLHRRRRVIQVLVSPAEYSELRRLAGIESLSRYLREKGLGL